MILASVAPHDASELDGLTLFGFVTACVTVFFLVFQYQSWPCLWLLTLGLAASAAYGLLQGAWPLSIVLAASCARKAGQLYASRPTPAAREARSRRIASPARMAGLDSRDSRMLRMFGPQ